MTNDKPKTKRDPTLLLKAAIDTLEQFSQKNETAAIPHVHHFDVIDNNLITEEHSPLQKVKTFIGAVLSTEVRRAITKRKIRVQDKVLDSIDIVKSHYLLIEKLKQGNHKEQKLAASAVNAIKRYNAIIEQAKQDPDNWTGKLARFLYEQSGLSVDNELKAHAIDLPHPVTISYNKKITQAFHTACYTPVEVDVRLRDAFIMKSARLLEGFTTNLAEALKIARSAPITASTDKTTKAAILLQMLSPLPGIRVDVTCSIKPSASIPENFTISYHCTQTGFPHPSQNSGWALADQMIPPCPHRLDELPHFHQILQRKKHAASELLPKGQLVSKAMHLLTLKKQAFLDNKQNLIAQHKALSHAILAAAPAGTLPFCAAEIVDTYFNEIVSHDNGWERLTETYQMILEHYITKPHEALQHAWLDLHEDLFHNDPEKCYATAAAILKQYAAAELLPPEGMPAPAIAYIACMGSIIGKAAHPIILQHLSEIMEFAPPMLNTFEQKLQTTLYKQAEDFLNEINTEITPELIAQQMGDQLETDRRIFAAETFDDLEEMQDIASAAQIVNELEGYFNTRFLSRTK